MNPLALEEEMFAALNAAGDLDVLVSVERFHLDHRAQSRLRKGNLQLRMDVLTLTFKNLMFFNENHHMQITRNAASTALIALAIQAHPRTGVHAWGNL